MGQFRQRVAVWFWCSSCFAGGEAGSFGASAPVREPVAGLERRSDDAGGSGSEHSGSPLCDEYFVGGLDDARADGDAAVAEVAVSHALAVFAETRLARTGGGEGGIRTLGTQGAQRFSRPPRSTTPAPLHGGARPYSRSEPLNKAGSAPLPFGPAFLGEGAWSLDGVLGVHHPLVDVDTGMAGLRLPHGVLEGKRHDDRHDRLEALER